MKTYSASDVFAVLPFFLTAVLYGLAPSLSGPFLIFILGAASYLLRGPRVSGGIFWPVLPWAAAAFTLGLNANSNNSELGKGIAAALCFFAVLSGYPVRFKEILPIVLTAGAGFCAALSLVSRIFFPGTEINDLALRNPNILAMHLALLMPYIAHCWRSSDLKGERIFYGLVLIIASAAIFQAGAAGVLVSLLFAAAFFWKTDFLKKGALFCAAFFLLFAKFYLSPQTFLARWSWAKAAFSMFMDYPWLGSASKGGFMGLYPLYRGTFNPLENTLYAHNVYLEILAQWGLLGGAALLIAIFYLKDRLPRPMPGWLKFSLLFAALHGFWDSALLLLPNFMALCGLILAVMTSADSRIEKSWKTPAASFAGAAFALILCSASLSLSISRYSLFRAARWMDGWVGTDIREFHAHQRRSIRWDAGNPDAWSDRGRWIFMNSKPNSPGIAFALAAEKKARDLEGAKRSHWYNLKILYSAQ